jgi:hypothetical protein
MIMVSWWSWLPRLLHTQKALGSNPSEIIFGFSLFFGWKDVRIRARERYASCAPLAARPCGCELRTDQSTVVVSRVGGSKRADAGQLDYRSCDSYPTAPQNVRLNKEHLTGRYSQRRSSVGNHRGRHIRSLRAITLIEINKSPMAGRFVRASKYRRLPPVTRNPFLSSLGG